jgi:hypothetical protein
MYITHLSFKRLTQFFRVKNTLQFYVYNGASPLSLWHKRDFGSTREA